MAKMHSGLGGPTGYGENNLTKAGVDAGDLDDGSVFVDASSAFSSGMDVEGGTHTGFFINTNGSISFGSPVTDASGSEFETGPPVIAPFLTDIDLSSGGEVIWDVDAVKGTVTVTWLKVAPFSGTGTNSFQAVLTDSGDGDFDVEFIYEDIQFTDGGSGPAIVGFSDGNGNTHELDGSRDGSELKTFDSNDFGGGDPSGTFVTSFSDGYPAEIAPPDGTFDGTTGDDTIEVGDSDDDGDQVTHDADLIDAGAGDDVVHGGLGDDTILGGTGDDTIHSGSETGGGSWTQITDGMNVHGTSGQDFFTWSAGTNDHSVIRFNYTPPESGLGDDIADYVRVETTNTSSLTIGDFDVGKDKIVLQEKYTDIKVSDHGNMFEVAIGYSDGNVQTFRIYTDDGRFDPDAVFTTTEPKIPDLVGSDDDRLDGGDGSDVFVIADDSGNDTITGGEGGKDADLIDLGGISGSSETHLTGTGEGKMVIGDDTLTFSQIEEFELSDQSDSLDASSDTGGLDISAGAGDDKVQGGSGDDTISGGDGSDYLGGGSGSDSLDGGDGQDKIDAGSGNDTISGGAGDDIIRTGSGMDQVNLIHGGGVDTITDFDLDDKDGDGFSNDRLDVAGLTGGSGVGGAITAHDVKVTEDSFGNAVLNFPNGEQVVLQGVSKDDVTSIQQMNAIGIPCFTPGALVETADGPRPVQDLRAGDRVLTRDAGVQPVLWAGRHVLDADALADHPELRPVVIRKDVLGNRRRMVVSPQHAFLTGDRLIRARHLADRGGQVARVDRNIGAVTYVHLLLPRHQLLRVDGLWTESLYPGPQALGALGRASLLSLIAAAPHLAPALPLVGRPSAMARTVARIYGPPVRPYLTARQARTRSMAPKKPATRPGCKVS